jgi:phenylacetate-CoA ligase
LNVDALARLPGPLRRSLYFGLQRAIGSRIGPIWREFLRWEQLPPPAFHRALDERLASLLTHALRHSEYYRSLGIAPPRPGETAADALRRFPILSRTAVRDHFPRLVVDPLRPEIPGPDSVAPRRYDWLVVKTGGSTGIPTTVVHDRAGRDWGRATRLYALRLAGFPLGTPYFRLWGSEQDLLRQQISTQHRLLRALHAEVPLNAFRARESDLREHYHTLRRRPDIRHLMAYVDAAAGLAAYLSDRGLSPPKFETIMACAGTVTAEYRTLLETVFGAEVLDKYGSRECCDLACECRHHTGLHVFSPNAWLEIVDEQEVATPPGVPGRLLVTLLNNRGFPMIRYEIGDLAAWAPPGNCPCGSPFPRIQQLCGRQDDQLTTEDGTAVTSVFVRHFVGVSLNRQLIREWQLEQQSRDEFVFRYIPLRHDGLTDNLEALRRSFESVFGRSPAFRFEEVTAIPPTPSGKIRWIVNRLR